MDFIDDVVYGLKQDYGKPAQLSNESETTDLTTGNVTIVSDTFTLRKVIAMQDAFYNVLTQIILQIKQGDDKYQKRQFIVDVRDIPSGKTVKIGTYMVYEGSKYLVKQIDVCGSAMILTTKTV